MFLFNTYNIANGQTIANALLILGNGVQYPNEVLYPTSEKGRTYNELLNYLSTFSWYLMNPLIYYSNFQTLYGLIYCNLTCTQDIIKNNDISINIRFTLSGTPNNAYTLYCLVLHEQDISVDVALGKVVLRT